MEDIILIIFAGILILTFFASIKEKVKKKKFENRVSMENIPQEFKDIYNELYSKNATQLEELRKSIVSKYAIFGIIMVILVVFVLPQFYLMEELSVQIIVIGFLLTFIIFIGIMGIYGKRYVGAYKHNIISKFVKLVNENLEYKSISKSASTARPEYMMANFDSKPFNRFYQDDYIEGNIEEDVNMKIFDLHIQNVVKRGKNTYTEEIFQGIFARCTSLNNINTTIKITRNKLKILDSKDRIQMDSGEFEEYFDVYAEDKITAMRILTSEIMQCLIDFQNKYDLDFEIVFKNNVIYSRFFTGPMFEPKIIGDAMDEGLIFRYYTILKFIIDITQTVNASKKDLDI